MFHHARYRRNARRCGPWLVAAAFAIACAATAAAQDGPIRVADQPLRPIEQGVEDIDSLGTSLRLIEAGLSVPTGFSHVYEVPGHPGWLMRVDNGLFAVFRRSIYFDDMPTVPPDTVFHIGWPVIRPDTPALPERAQPIGPSDMVADRLDAMVQPQRADQPDAPLEPRFGTEITQVRQPHIASSAAYRAARLRELMREAAQGEVAPSEVEVEEKDERVEAGDGSGSRDDAGGS
jgi:hypothetical protein